MFLLVGICSAVLPLEADVLVDRQMTGARVYGSANRKSNDNACVLHQHDARGGNKALRSGLPRGINSAGIFLKRLRRCETVCAISIDLVLVSKFRRHNALGFPECFGDGVATR